MMAMHARCDPFSHTSRNNRRVSPPRAPDRDHDHGCRVGAWAAATALVMAVVRASGTVG